MKRFIVSFFLIIVSTASFAQLRVGGNFLLNFSNERTNYSSGQMNVRDLEYEITLNPKLYWNLNEKMNVGGRIGFSFGRVTTGYIQSEDSYGILDYLYELISETYDAPDMNLQKISNTAVSWSVNPFFAYRVFTWKILSVWGEANIFFGQAFNTGTKKASIFEWDKQLQYGIQVLPVVNIDVSEKFAIQFHLGFPSLMWFGETSHYADRYETVSTWTLRKGGLAGLIQGFSNYGLGLVRKF